MLLVRRILLGSDTIQFSPRKEGEGEGAEGRGEERKKINATEHKSRNRQ